MTDEQRDLDAVLTLGALAPRLPWDEVGARLRAIPPRRAATWLVRHKVLGLLRRRLDEDADVQAAVPDGLLEALDPHFRRVAGMSARLGEEQEHLRALVSDRGVRCFLIKGAAARGWYERPGDRDVGDLDVHVPDADEAFDLAAAVAAEGFSLDPNELPWVKANRFGRIYGQVLLYKDVGLPAPVNIDIHFGGYSVRHCGLLDLDPGDVGPGLHALDGARNLPVIVANGAGDFFVALKDLNDLHLCLGDPEFDWETARRAILRAGLDGFFDNMLAMLDRWFAPDPERAGAARRVRFGQHREIMPLATEAHWRLRWVVTTEHAIRLGLRDSVRSAARAGWTAATYYFRPLRLRVEDRPRPGTRRVVLPRDLDPCSCVRLVPSGQAAKLTDHQKAGGAMETPLGPERPVPGTERLRVLATDHGDLVRLNGQTFIPTVDYRLPGPLVDAAARQQPAATAAEAP